MQFENFIKENGLYGITGSAGAGKTSIVTAKDLNFYSIDWRFIQDAESRKKSLESDDIEQYISACNQYGWWDWSQIEQDLNSFIAKQPTAISNYYNRVTGKFEDGSIELSLTDKLFVEGSILGSQKIVEKFNLIFFLFISAEEKFRRLLEKDRSRRTFAELVNRFMITEYSERVYYTWLFANYFEKIICVDQNQDIIDSRILFDYYLSTSEYYLPIKVV